MSDALEGKGYVGIVNGAAGLALLSRPDLAAYVSIAERLGSLQAQLMSGKLSRLSISLQGPLVSDLGIAAALRTAVLKGLLTVTQGEAGGVNYVNTPLLARELGIDVQERVSTKPSAYTNLITVTLETGSGETRSIAASVFDGTDGRVVSFDGFKVDINPRGEMLFFNNSDKPGVLHRITTVLAKAGVNIAHFGLGRHAAGGDALGVLTVDSPVPDDAVRAIRELPNVLNVRTASLPVSTTDVEATVAPLHTAVHDEMQAAGKVVGAPLRPAVRPSSPNFGSGPTKKRPGWSLAALSDAALGRSHRSKLGKGKLSRAIDMTRDVLGVPKGAWTGCRRGRASEPEAVFTSARVVASIHPLQS